jgi:Orsellinic acid/F9775 biosynthesis cluster protein D
MAFSDADLLKYDAAYCVLICRECKYAIQKNALDSHLLRHKIYRGDRQRLLSSISRLRILDSDDVQLPPAGSLPVDGLPVISGYRCRATGCGSLYGSIKRMRKHWTETHDISIPGSFACPVNLQTFFRGTKLKYFEVAKPSPTEDIEQQHTPLNINPARSSAQTSAPRYSHNRNNLDLETLRYFHHFITTTSLTLPAYGLPAYWQTDVVARALQLRWLMSGLLAISASHLSTISDDETEKRAHLKRSTQFHQDFLTGWEEVKRASGVDEAEEAKLGGQIFCIQRCCRWTFDLELISLESFSTTIRGCVDPSFPLRSITSDDNDTENLGRINTASRGSNSIIPSNGASAILESIRSLPHRMVEKLGKPDNVQDVLVTLSAIDELAECYSLSFEADDIRTAWTGMESWLSDSSDHFNELILRRTPAALVVFAHWLFLVERTAHYCWFLRGAAAKLLHRIEEDLPEDGAVRSLLDDLGVEASICEP